MPKKAIVLGGGISGLTHAWSLKKKFGPDVEITILEKSNRLGGHIQTVHDRDCGFLFEIGPRSCRPKGSGVHTLQLIEELDLQNQVIVADKKAKIRYLYVNKNLTPIPYNLPTWLSSPFLKEIVPAIWRDLWTNPVSHADESIYHFFSHRIGPRLTNLLIDPIVSGIFAGDIHHLSMQACFPSVSAKAQEYGSLLRGILFSKKRHSFSTSSFIKNMQKSTLFSFKNGMETIIHALEKRLECEIHLNCSPTSIDILKDRISVKLGNGKTLESDELISTIPSYEIVNALTNPELGSVKNLLDSICYVPIVVVSLGYKKNVLNKKGFGYLIPQQEDENILGCVWDSNIFPQQNYIAEETRLTVMIGGAHHFNNNLSSEDYKRIALDSLSKHMGLQTIPDAILISEIKLAIPQYHVGHLKKCSTILNEIKKLFPHFHLKGNFLNGVSVNECIQNNLVNSCR